MRPAVLEWASHQEKGNTVSGNLGGWTGLIVLVVVLLLFGAPKLPGLAKSVGQSLKIFKAEVRGEDDPKDSSAGGKGSDGPNAPTR
jgi:sec-independent protein translocase protein TatA